MFSTFLSQTMKSGIFVSLFISAPALAADYVIVPDTKVIKELHPSPNKKVLGSAINLLVWNTHKGSDGNNWAQDLKRLSADRDLVLLQEGMDDNFMPSVLKTIDSLGWLIGQSFFMERDHDGTGVITGSATTATETFFHRTKHFEPVVKTPKVTLFTTYVMEKGSNLLVANIHGINFTSMGAFTSQIDAVTTVIKSWKGKVIFAGDFNTWSAARMDYLDKKAREAGLTHLLFPNDPRDLVLDHVFLRGCYSFKSVVHGNVKTSDHKPLTNDLICPE